MTAPPRTTRARLGRRLVGREFERFLRRPPSVRAAAAVIVAATTVVVVAAGILVRVFDAHDFPTLRLALWWALQTATTVGYGDVVPHTSFGYLVGALVMLEGIAFLAVVTASITSTFVTRAQRELGESDDAHWDEVARRLARIERALGLDPAELESPASHDAAATPRRLDRGRRRPHGRLT